MSFFFSFLFMNMESHIEHHMYRGLMMLHVAHTEVNAVIPGKKAKEVVKELVQPLGFKRGTVAELMCGCLHSHEPVEHAVEIAGSSHRYP